MKIIQKKNNIDISTQVQALIRTELLKFLRKNDGSHLI